MFNQRRVHNPWKGKLCEKEEIKMKCWSMKRMIAYEILKSPPTCGRDLAVRRILEHAKKKRR